MATAATPQMTPEEYLERERKAQFKSEYLSGRMIAMGGTSIPHGRIVTNLRRELSQVLLDGPCNVYTTEHWMRQTDRHWLLKEYRNLEETMESASIGVSLPLSRIYAKVDLARMAG